MREPEIEPHAVAPLSEDRDAARRIAFVVAKVAQSLKLPFPCSPGMLLQAAMEQPEAVTPEEYAIIYLMRSPEALQ